MTTIRELELTTIRNETNRVAVEFPAYIRHDLSHSSLYVRTDLNGTAYIVEIGTEGVDESGALVPARVELIVDREAEHKWLRGASWSVLQPSSEDEFKAALEKAKSFAAQMPG